MAESLVGYVTVEEADAYIAGHYLSTSEEATRWTALSAADKAVYLLNSFEAIELLPFKGRKVYREQKNSFPRTLTGFVSCNRDYTVPNAVKYSQIENALKLSENVDTSEYEQMRLQGIKSYSIGNLSETLDGTSVSSTIQSIMSAKALRLLQPYLSGGYEI